MRSQIIQNQTQKSSICFSTSTFLIPSKFEDFFKQKCIVHGSRRAYLSFVVSNYLPEVEKFLGRLDRRRVHKWKICYQAEGQLLLKRNFIPIPSDWEAFRNCAGVFGVSMCFLFVFIMELEMQGILQTEKYGNSVHKTCIKPRKFRKFSIIYRLLDFPGQILERKLKQSS